MSLGRLLLILCCAAYYLVLQFSYRNLEGVMFTELGLVVRPPSAIIELLALIQALIPACVLPLAIRKPSDVAQYGLYLTVISPLAFVPHHVLDAEPLSIFVFSNYLNAVFCGLIWFCQRDVWRFPSLQLDPQSIVSCLIGVNFALILVVSGTSGFQYDLSMESHYDRRMVAREVVSSGSLQAYSIATLSGAVAPLLVSIGYLWRRPFALASGCLGLITIFAFSGTKTELFTTLFLAGMYALMMIDERRRGIAAMLAAVGLVLASLSQFYFFDRYEISLYFCRRTLFVPALLTSIYWDFFSQNPHVYYSDSFLRWLFQSPYDLPMARTIGATYFGSHEANANANIWASAFGHMGYFGVAFTTLIFGLLLRTIDAVAALGDARLACMITALFAMVWSNGALETSILTNGVGVSIMMIWAVASKVPDGVAATHAALSGSSKSSSIAISGNT